MTNLVTAIGTTVSAMNADRRPQRDSAQPEMPGEDRPEPSALEPAHAPTSPPATARDPAVQPQTLLSASLLGQRLRTLDEALRLMRRAQTRAWAPPESAFKLKDKTI